MKFKYYLIFIFYTLLFLFYAGNSHYFSLFAFNRDLFASGPQEANIPAQLTIPVAPEGAFPPLSAHGVYVVDLNSFSPVLDRSSRERFFPASTAKVMTALVAFDLYRPDDVVTVRRVITEGQTMGLGTGEKITVENLLYGTLIQSGNDAAYALADKVGEGKFVALMNKKAQKLGMKNSQFKDPAGFDEDGQYTTPFDLALAGRELLKNKYLTKIVGIKQIIVPDTEFKYSHTLTNVNRLLGELKGVGGLKTGSTPEAGENLVTFYRKNGHDFLIVLMKSEDRFEDTMTLVEWIDTNVSFETVSL